MRAETFKPAKIPSDIMKKVYTFNQGGKLCLRTHTIDISQLMRCVLKLMHACINLINIIFVKCIQLLVNQLVVDFVD
jgi:hypothetical protein